jgi:hypothetical protein
MTQARPVTLTALDHEILRLLLIGPFQRADDLAALLGVRYNHVLQRLATLANLDLIADILPGCMGRNSARFAYLTPRGVALLAAATDTSPLRFAQRWHVDMAGLAHLLVRLPALATVQARLPDLVRAAHAAMQMQYAPREQAVTWSWVRDYRYRLRDSHRRLTVAADGLIVFRPHLRHPIGTGLPADLILTYACWLLLDPGIGGDDVFVDCLAALLRLREQRQVDEGIVTFPPVLIYTASPFRAAIWRRAAQHAARVVACQPLDGLIQITPPAPQDWWPPYPVGDTRAGATGEKEWSDLSTGERRHLHHLFATPLTPDALPPAITPYLLPHAATAAARSTTVIAPRTYTPDLIARLDRAWQRANQSDTAVTRLGRHILGLTRRHIQVLGALAAHPGIPLIELGTLLDIAAPTCRVHYLSPLIDQGLVAHSAIPCPTLNRHVPTPAGQHTTDEVLAYSLTTTGLALLAHLQNLPRQRVPDAQNTALFTRRAGSLGQHNIGVYRFFALLIAATREQNELHRVMWWETGSACIRRFATARRTDGTIVFATLRPDAIGEYAWGNRRLRFMLEWDMGTMTTTQLLQKFVNYGRYAHSRAYQREGARSLPVLYVVTLDAAHEARIARILDALVAEHHLTPNGNLAIRTTTFALLAESGPLARIWQPHLPRQQAILWAENAAARSPLAMLDEIRPLGDIFR